jgi:insecticidal toxin complex protein TccC
MSEACALHAHTPTLTVVDPRGLAVRSVSFHRSRADEPVTERVDRSSVDPARRLIRRWDPRLWTDAGSEADTPSNLRSLFSLTSQVLLSESVDAGWEVALFGSGGERRCRWDAKGHMQRLECDEMLRPESVFEADGLTERCTERLTYGSANDAFANQCGQLIRHDDPAGTVTNRVFSLKGEVIEQTHRFLKDLGVPDWPDVVAERDEWLEPGEGAKSSWRFGPSGDALEQIDAMGNVQTFAHTVAGQLKFTGLQLPGQPAQTLVSDIDYDAQGRIQSETAGNGIVTAVDYDPVDGRLIRLRADNGLVQDLNYAYDPVGNVLSIEDLAQPIRYFANQQVEPLRTFAYDTLYQLIEATGYEAKTMSRGPANDAFRTFAQADELGGYTQLYDYDAGGNLRTLVHVGSQNFTRRFATASTSNRSVLQATDQPPSDEQIAASFDPNGNLRTLQAGQDLAWDSRNQLSEVTPVERESGINDSEVYRYDAAGMRARKVRITQAKTVAHHNEVRYLPSLEIRTNTATGEVLHVITVTAGRSDARVLHWQAGKPESLENDQVRYSLSDHLGSSTLELDAEAQLISQEIYYPYGETAWFAGRSEVEVSYKTIRYSGKERDATGLYYYGLRYYAPWLMRWINPDPAGEVDGTNRYAFVRANPISASDPDGAMLRWFSDLNDPPILMIQADGFRVRYRGVDQMLQAGQADLVFSIDTALITAKSLIEDELSQLRNGETERLSSFLAIDSGTPAPQSLVDSVIAGYQKISDGLGMYQHGGSLRGGLTYVERNAETAPNVFAMMVPGDPKKRMFLTEKFITRSVITNASTVVHETSHLVMDTQDDFYYSKAGLQPEDDMSDVSGTLNKVAAAAVEKNRQYRQHLRHSEYGHKTFESWALNVADFWGHYLIAKPLSDEQHSTLQLYSANFRGRATTRHERGAVVSK